MTAEPFGPAGKKHRQNLSFDERTEAFQKEFGFEIEPEPTQDNIPPESSWDADGDRSMWAQYFKRHPAAKPIPAKPRELKKTVQIAPGTYLEDYLPKLLEQAKTLVESHRALQEKIDAFEQKQLDECTSKPDHVWLDGECVRVQSGVLDNPTAPPVPAGMAKAFTKSSPSIDIVSGRPFCSDIEHLNGHRHIHETGS